MQGRAQRAGAEVTVASVEDSLQITASRGVKLVANKAIADCADCSFDLIVLPVRAVLCEVAVRRLCAC